MKTVGVYEYDEKDEIGRGTYGVVYKGRNKTQLPEVVAIKEVRLDTYNDLINREIEILKALSNKGHKNIVTLLHWEKQTHHVYFVMEFCNGGSLKEYLKSKERFAVITFLHQIAAGLKVAHDMNIIHRDLKPDNILLCFSGPKYPSPENITLKIADFGIGRFLHSDEMASTNCGSLPYMAPEVLIQRPGGYDYKADLWSLGVIGYECFFGSLPKSSIALNGFQTPLEIRTDIEYLLQGLLQNDEKKRFTLKHVLDFQFSGSIITVVVYGSHTPKFIHVHDSQSVDLLTDVIFARFNCADSKDLRIVPRSWDVHLLSGNSIRDCGIVHMNSFDIMPST